MNPIAVWLSVALHIAIFTFLYLNLDSIIKSNAIKDNGHAVFDFVTIGPKSKAPVLSSTNSRASKNKSYIDKKMQEKVSDNTSEKTTSSKNDNSTKDTREKRQNKSTNTEDKKETAKPLKSKEFKSNIDNKSSTSKSKNNDKSKGNKKSQTAKNKNNKNKNTTTKNNTRFGNKALVNLSDKKKKSLGLSKGAKGAFDSIIDSALADGDSENSGLNAEEIGDMLTATQIDLIRETIRPCWHFPAGLKDADKLIVDIKMELDQDGYVKTANVIDKTRMTTDKGFRTAAESALRAVLDPECNPLPLPKDKYNEWKDLELSFNPQDWT